MNEHTPRLELIDLIEELVSPHQVTAHYTTRKNGTWVGENYITDAASLLVQLLECDPASNTEGDGVRAFGSKPVARVEALDAYDHIADEASRWVTRLGGTDNTGTATKNILRINGLAAGLDKKSLQYKALRRDVRRWWIHARIITGWDSAAWCPDNTCPACGASRKVRIRLSEKIASCIACHTVWTEKTWGILSAHIAQENDKPKPIHADISCWCPNPLPFPIDDLRHTCKRCGSARCRWAIVGRIDELTHPDTPESG